MLNIIVDKYFKTEISLPTTKAERDDLSAAFEAKMGIQGVIGAIYGVLIKINLPPNEHNARSWRCYKSFYALNVQAAAGPNVWILISFCFLISITPGAHGTLGHI